MTETSIVRVIGTELLVIVDPLRDVVDARDPSLALDRFLRSCGWKLVAEIDPVPIVDAFGAIIEKVVQLVGSDDPDDLEALVGALAKVGTTVDALFDLGDALQAAAGDPPTAAELAVFVEDFGHRLMCRWLQQRAGMYEFGVVTGLVETTEVAEATLGGWLRRRPQPLRRFRADLLFDFLNDPLATIAQRILPNDWASSVDAAATNLFLTRLFHRTLADWGGSWTPQPDAVASAADAGRLSQLSFLLPLPDEVGRASAGAEIEMFSRQDHNLDGLAGPAVEIAPFGRYAQSVPVGDWTLAVLLAISLGGVDAGDSRPLLRISSDGLSTVPSLDTEAAVALTIPVTVRVGGNHSRLDLGTLTITAFTRSRGNELDLGFGVVFDDSSITISAGDLGPSVRAVADFETTVELALGLAWSRSGGLSFAGRAALEFELSEGLDIGGVIAFSGLRLRIEVAELAALSIESDVTVNLGPVAMAFEDLGIRAELGFPADGGNLGGAALSMAPQFPKGIGVRVDAGVVVGGGYLYLDPERGEYAGVLELSFPTLSLSLKAVGIFTTSVPGGSGFALLLLIFAEFPAVQLGYGFTLNGVGGILGLQHGIDTDALQSGLRTGSLDSVLFPDDPVANAPTVLRDLRATFPVTVGALTFGPVLQIGWGAGIITLSLGLVFQFNDVLGSSGSQPSIARIVLLGQLKIQLPPIDDVPELVKLLVDIIGYYEFEEQELGMDARLRDSHLAGLPLTGSLVVRARFGDDPTFALAVGGFHPRFTDLPPGIPPQDRLGVVLRYGILTADITCYLAITSNTFQVGANVSLVVAAAGFRVDAYLGFDALFIFQPEFLFEIDFRVGASIRWKRWTLASIRVTGTLSGPGLWRVQGSASFSVLFWDVDVDFDESWGRPAPSQLPPTEVLPALARALEDLDNWSAALPSGDALVTLRQLESATLQVHPLARLHVREKVVPLGLRVERVGQARPSDGNRFDLDSVIIGGVEQPSPTRSKEHFARGDYFDLSEDDKLSSPSFERFDAGAAIGSHDYAIADEEVAFDPVFETVYLEHQDDSERGQLPSEVLYLLAGSGAASYSQLRKGAGAVATVKPKVTVEEPAFAAVAESSYHVLDTVDASGTVAAVEAAGYRTYSEAAERSAKYQRRSVVAETFTMTGVAP